MADRLKVVSSKVVNSSNRVMFSPAVIEGKQVAETTVNSVEGEMHLKH